VKRYGDEHPEVYGGVSGPGSEADTAYIIGFTSDLELHCWALRDLVDYPEAFSIIQVPYSLADKGRAARRAEELGAEVGGVDMKPLRIALAASEEAVAESLHAEFGAMLDISINGLPYPPAWREDQPDACPARDDPPQLADLQAIVVDPPDIMPAYSPTGLTIRVTNTGASRGVAEWAQQTLSLYGEDGETRLTTFTGPRTLAIDGIELEEGGAFTLTAIVAVTPCGPRYILPPGQYQVAGSLSVTWNGDPRSVAVSPIPVSVVDR
jgi:hypothetical protein